jgi:predicted acetyltransferase
MDHPNIFCDKEDATSILNISENRPCSSFYGQILLNNHDVVQEYDLKKYKE